MVSLNDHLKQFYFVQVPRSHQGCTRYLQRRHLAIHSQDECEYRLLPCPHCEIDKAAISLENHIEECSYRPVKCTNECVEEVIQGELAEHLQEHCTLLLVSCQNQGCDKTIQQCHLADHLKDVCEYRLLPCPHCDIEIAVISLVNL